MRTFCLRPLTLLLSTVYVCLASAHADTIDITGTAFFGRDIENFFISGPSLDLHSTAPGATASLLFTCNVGGVCVVPSKVFDAFSHPFFSGGTVNGIRADTLVGGIEFSSSSIIGGSDPQSFGTGPITFTGEIEGFLFSPLVGGVLGPQVFDLDLHGTGTVTASGHEVAPGVFGVFDVNYQYSGTASTVPEPSSIWLIGGGLAGLLGLRRRKALLNLA
jgi:hypothetical protein